MNTPTKIRGTRFVFAYIAENLFGIYKLNFDACGE